MPSKVKDYLTPAEFVAWMDEHGWTVAGLAAADVVGKRSSIFRLRNGDLPVSKVLTLALPAINKAFPRSKRGAA